MKVMRFGTILSLFTVLLFACKKKSGDDPIDPNPGGGGGGTTATLADLQKDSAVGYSQDIYLWYKQIPANFNGRTYADLNEVMKGIRAYSMEPGFSSAVDRWSFAIDKASWDNTSSGIAQDFGMYVFFLNQSDLRIRFVEKNSPADKAGLRRGYQITRINSLTNITTASANGIVDAIYNSSTVTLGFTRHDGTTGTTTLNAATYVENPVLLDTVYNLPGKKAGYLVFNSFLGDTTIIYNSLNKAFSNFTSQGITDLIVDLRYNGGGYISVQERLANMLAPTAAHGKVMMSQVFNDKYTRYNETKMFSKIGSLNLPRIIFIVSSNTASASELLINNLKPYMQVRVIGPQASYGKPVGYFPIPIGNQYIFPVSLRTTNGNNEGNYFNGFVPEKATADGLDRDWGNIEEASLSSAIKFITTGVFVLGRDATLNSYQNTAVKSSNAMFNADRFNGAVASPIKK